MFTNEDLELLKQLLSTPSPTGFETAGQKIWLNYVKQFADDITADSYGSAAAHINADSDAITVMIEAHCDEIGMMINYIDDNGFVYVTRLGGSDPAITRARRVHIHTREGIVAGVTGNTAIHLQDKDKKKVPEWGEIFIDIGVTNREDAIKLVQVGNAVTYADDYEFLNEEIITARALDNRIGGFIIAQVLKRLSEERDKLQVNVVAVNSVQEEIGGFGARMMSLRLNPDLALVTDVTHATDTPGIDQRQHGKIELGKGAALQYGSANHPVLVRHLEDVARQFEVPVQYEANSNRTGTDTDSIFYQNGGIPSALVSVPLRYMHSPAEIVHIKDVEYVVELMMRGVQSLERNASFNVL
ncbi:MAG TPA: M42 family metallopeptidase [Balneolales bacterium]|nr:M42 family metallopeptidase [Balneolales bacterium]